MIQFIGNHQYIFGLASLWVFAAIVGGMPEPDPASGKGYIWAYRSLHLLAANLDKFKNGNGQPK